jgi:hypothetical protein
MASRVSQNYLQTLRILNKTRQLSKKTNALKFVKKQYQQRQEDLKPIGQLYAGYLKELTDYTVRKL